MDVGVHDDVLGGCGLGDIVPDLETGGILSPTWHGVSLKPLAGGFGRRVLTDERS